MEQNGAVQNENRRNKLIEENLNKCMRPNSGGISLVKQLENPEREPENSMAGELQIYLVPVNEPN
jgi:hypothetical protein